MVDFGTCVINLDANLDRRRAMQAEFARAGLTWRRVPGVLPTAIPENLRGHFTDASGDLIPSLTPGEIGCFAAHLSVMGAMAAGELEPVMLVLEDDCTLPPALEDQVRMLIRSLPSDWDMVRLCNTPKRAYVELDRLACGHAIVRYSTIPNFTGAYLVSLPGARKLLAAGAKTIPFDGYLREAWRHDCNVFGVWPPMVVQHDADSVIDRIDEALQTGRGSRSKRADRSPLGRRLAWQIGTLGRSAFIACRIVDAADAVLRRSTGRTIIHRAAPLLARLRPRSSNPARAAGRRRSRQPAVPGAKFDIAEA